MRCFVFGVIIKRTFMLKYSCAINIICLIQVLFDDLGVRTSLETGSYVRCKNLISSFVIMALF